MSVEPSTLERSALERKDREELTTIAQALGVKPPSRARKAEIVQLILELTGVESGAAADAAPARNSGKEASVDDDDSTSTTGSSGEPAAPDAPDASPAAGGTGGDNGAPADDEPPSAWELEFGGTTDVVDAPAGEQPSGGSSPGGRTAPGARSGAGNGTRTRSSDASAGGKGDGEQRADTAPAARGESGGARAAGSGGAPSPGGREGQANGSGQPEAGRAGAQQAGDGQQGGDGQGGDQGRGDHVDVNEPGNRRRRRRGRRGKDEQTHVEEFAGEPVEVEGLLDLRDEGYGFLRVKGYLPSKDDIYVSVKQVRQFGLRKGDHVSGASRPAMRNEKNPALLRIDKVNGTDPEQARKRRRFEDLTPLFPDEKLTLETANDASNMTARIVDLIAPIGKGQRGLIVSPPKAGKTAIVKQIARSVETNNPEVKLLVLLVDERPEEVTDMRRWLRAESSEVVASTFDRPAEEHTQVAELTIERAKRLVEDGQDVCIILDGITRLARAYNLAAPATGRIMSGGVDSGALYPPKKFFGAARNIEEGGSLTILATALIETGSKMDEVIFEEFKGTGNMELRLDRRLAERRIYPAIDVDASSTRHEELLFPRNQLNLVWALRRVLSALSSSDGGNAAALELLMDRMKTFRTNDEFLAEVAKNRLAAG
jgi:transcription termination factor Rho